MCRFNKSVLIAPYAVFKSPCHDKVAIVAGSAHGIINNPL